MPTFNKKSKFNEPCVKSGCYEALGPKSCWNFRYKDIGFNIMSLFHYPRRVRIVTCEALEEAMKVLAG